MRKLNKDEELYFKYLKEKDYAELSYLLNNKRDLIDSIDEKGNYGLHIAVQLKDVKLVKLLIKFGCDVNSQNAVGKTAKDLTKVHINDEIEQILNSGDLIS